MNKLQFTLLPKSWFDAYNFLRYLTNLSNFTALKIISLSIFVTILEGIGISLILPLLDAVEGTSMLKVSDENNVITNFIIYFFNFIGLPTKFITISLLVVIVIVFRQYTSYVLNIILAKVKTQNEEALRNKIFASTFLSAPHNIENLGNGSYIELMTNQSTRATLFLVQVIHYISSLLLCLCYITIALIMAPKATLVTLVIGLLILLFSSPIISKIREITNKNVQEYKSFSKHLGECFLSWKVIKLSDAFNYEKERNAKLTNSIASQGFYVEKNLSKIKLAVTIIIILILVGVLNIGVNFTNVELNLLVMFSIMCIRLIPIVLSIIAYQAKISIAAESVKRVYGVINSLNENREHDTGSAEMPNRNDINIKNISFKYPGSESLIFKDFSAIIPAKKVTTIKGESGSGKSTLVDILARIQETYAGEVLINTTSIKNIKLKEYRKGVSLLSQNPVIFDDTVTSNIKYGNHHLNQDEVEEAAKLANAHDFVNKMSDKYNTILGERGSKLSGGQIQRIGLARILASKSDIIILDEPTSSLDNLATTKILEALINIKNTHDYTLIIVSHSKRLLDLGDHKIEIDKLS